MSTTTITASTTPAGLQTTPPRPTPRTSPRRPSKPTSASPRTSTPRGGPRYRSAGPDRRYVLSIAEIDEVLALVDDLAGVADEDLLDAALESLYQPVEYTDAVKAQSHAGTIAVFRLECEERLELRTLISNHNYCTSAKMRTQLSRLLHEARTRTHQTDAHRAVR